MSNFKVELRRRDLSEEELLADLRRVASEVGSKTVTVLEYKERGKFGSTTVLRRFSSWNVALEKAGLKAPNRQNIPDEELMENIVAVWTVLGRQPFGRELDKGAGLSNISLGTYEKRFGSWNNALIAFDEFINSEEKSEALPTETENADQVIESSSQLGVPRHKTKREISDRMRFKILMRDGFSCQSCGKSPTTERGVELHVDHILPWSKGGETVEENLQTKCAKCNLGKGNVFDV